MLASFALGVWAFVRLSDRPPDARVVHDTLFTWLKSGAFRVDMNILFDPLSAVMLLVVSGVGFLIHVYSVGYMHRDGEERRYFSYLNLFVFSMLLLVLSSNFVLLLAGWGLVGLSSYLLIGFWHQRAVGGRRGQEGVRHERRRRHRHGARHLPDLPASSARSTTSRCSSSTPSSATTRRPSTGSACCS